MKNVKNKYKTIITIIYIVILFIMFSYLIRPDRNVSGVEGFIKDSFSGIEKRLTTLTITETIKEYESYQNKQTQNNNRIKELELEIKRLKETLELKNSLSNYICVNSTIINHNNGYWYNSIKIDKGSNDGIKENMAVINNQGLIGKILSVTKKTSTVELLSNDNYQNKISIKIESDRNTIYGLLTLYNQKNNTYRIEGISENTPINIGDTIKTTGFSEIYPGGLIVGTVKNITKDNFDLTRIIEATPSVNFDEISYVTVLINEK